MKRPNQPTYTDQHGVERFDSNRIVRLLLDVGGLDMNKLATMDFSNDDRAQFAQLIGYSVSGWSDLSYVSDTMWDRLEAERMAPHTADAYHQPDRTMEGRG